LPSLHFRPPPPTGILALSLPDALPICSPTRDARHGSAQRLRHTAHAVPHIHDGADAAGVDCIRGRIRDAARVVSVAGVVEKVARSEEHTSELQSLAYLVCRLLLEKKKL